MKRLTIAVAGWLALMAMPSKAEDAIKPGLWKITTIMLNNGIKVPPQISMRCLTAEQAGNIAGTFSPQFGGVNTVCERTEYEESGQKMTWRLQCKGQMNMDVAGKFSFDSPLHYTAAIATKGWMAGQLIFDSIAALEGEHVGECS